ncbi:hypothetical protein APHCRT_1478 [Anaplasma phagocytophilum str. CRT53-1]|nr:hypothetical protein APHCRT_1478 [Anaplasma phagocytophilum str. CRT53-1]KJV85010.1 hypothetical protein APHWI1_0852 [Anaplasma phagocytophilum str. ApWI1]KJV86325.1 hypothetical protein APHNYW_1395 [Anaplasma phagocytophilum str. ApNYW]KJV99596.1 hypothetical protein OTSANNIE_0025 [Anaplasma phagocytophilum str. Annie]KKA00045.1 hypothetical protein APHDU1_0618 [Anaplasma phagocytophilum]
MRLETIINCAFFIPAVTVTHEYLLVSTLHTLTLNPGISLDTSAMLGRVP